MKKKEKNQTTWKEKLEKDYLKYGYEKTVERAKSSGTFDYQMWKYLNHLMEKHRQKYREINGQFIPIK